MVVRTIREPIHWRGQMWFAILSYPPDSEVCSGYEIISKEGISLSLILKSDELMDSYNLTPEEGAFIIQKVENWIAYKEGRFKRV